MPSERDLIQQIQSHVTRLVQAVSDARFWHDRWLQQAEQGHQHRLAELEVDYKQAMAAAKSAYEATLSKVTSESDALAQAAGLLAAPWDAPLWASWTPLLGGGPGGVTRIGQLTEAGQWHRLTLPALLPIIGGRNVVIKASGAAKEAAVRALQSLMLRLLATIPPGKLRFLLMDPQFGQSVAGFVRDLPEELTGGKAWFEAEHMKQQLAALSEHMGMVIQKYLGNQYPTLEDYNAVAGEVAEPYRFLVVIDFPANFTSEAAGEAARRLVNIAASGSRCGVYTLVTVDTDQPLPSGFNLADLERTATVITWDGEHFVWQDPDFKDCLLELDAPPPSDLFDRILAAVGAAAKEAMRVEVPFEKIAPPPALWWRGDTRDGLVAPLGRAGATKVQFLDLGTGTAQHALVAGKTGAGKSTLLHTLIITLCLTYPPDELEFYLVDFKKGVEFKTYATHQLPHARVVAIESEREFGLSVLQGLDAELKRRGELFRAAGVDHIADYRAKAFTSSPPNIGRGEGVRALPRILLLVDEFQEFFTEDDAIASQAWQILDRLVRQGRAFGIHVLLGSQTLAGAHTLARSTIDQMAVRIALQCSEADSRLILAEDNPAARLLSRPGEAIYNAANGLVEGNTLFQVAWLPDEERDAYLQKVQQMAQERGYVSPQPQIVFEGNAPADVTKNRLLNDLLTTPFPMSGEDWRGSARKVAAWLGEPVAIKEPTAAYFRRQSGSNLLIVGQNDEAALGMMAVALVSLAAQHAPESAAFYILDFGAVDAAHAGLFERLAHALPHTVRVGRRRELPEILNELAEAVQQRLDNEQPGAPALYLFLYGLQRARDLRQEEMGFSGFGSFGEEPAAPNPAQQFATLLREGPDVGIHTVVWCDTVTNLNRSLDRRALREFAMQVVFQMSAEDSANLIDSPLASKLGPYRALFYDEEKGQIEKFRPYGVPAEEWIQQVKNGPRLNRA
jgi:nucleotide-binding universal stress UspA family protein/energy-coupling factor transporter ATP-binding protein EcfA2